MSRPYGEALADRLGSRVLQGFSALDAGWAWGYVEVVRSESSECFQEVDMRKKVAFLLFLLTFVLTLPATANPPALDRTGATVIQAAPQN
jgi:hypothetical protein